MRLELGREACEGRVGGGRDVRVQSRVREGCEGRVGGGRDVRVE